MRGKGEGISSTTQPGLPQYLNYAWPVAEGVIQNKDGAFLTAFEYAGEDQEYADFRHMAAVADHMNQELRRLRSGWMFEANSLRLPVVLPSAVTHCSDATSAMVHAERQARYMREGAHYETRHVLTLTYLPPGEVRQQFSDFFFQGARKSKKASREELLSLFIADTQRIAEALAHFMTIQRLDDNELRYFLHVCVTGRNHPVGPPPDGIGLDYAIGTALPVPAVMVGIRGFPDGTTPQLFAPVLELPFTLRMTHRFISLNTEAAKKDLENQRADWVQLYTYSPRAILWKVLQNPLAVDPNNKDVVSPNTEAQKMRDGLDMAKAEAQSEAARYGYYTMTVTTHDPDPEIAHRNALEVVNVINRLGFTAHIESDQAEDAFGGSWPGHGTRNVCKPRFNTKHLARLWPTSQPWRGEKTHPCPFYPPNSGPLLVTTTTGNTPFFLNLHVRDLGHTLLIGPSGNGKSYFLGAVDMAHLQYERSQINHFDRDAASVMPTLACGGEFFDLDAMDYAPLAFIDEEEERDWAVGFCSLLAKQQNFAMTPLARVAIERAVKVLSSSPRQYRTITNLLGQLQTEEVGLCEALLFYTRGHGGGMLDGVYRLTQDSQWLTFDMEKLLGRGPAVSGPVLTAQFHLMNRKMDGRPTIMPIDEGWMVAADELFRDHIEEDSATGRKKNEALILVLHSPGALAMFPRRDTLLSNIATMVFLPNERAEDAEIKPHYQALGLNDREIHLMATEWRARRDYYVVQGKKRRLCRLDTGPFAHALLGVNGRDHKERALALRAQYGQDWLPIWLKEQGHGDLAEQRRNWGGLRDAA